MTWSLRRKVVEGNGAYLHPTIAYSSSPFYKYNPVQSIIFTFCKNSIERKTNFKLKGLPRWRCESVCCSHMGTRDSWGLKTPKKRLMAFCLSASKNYQIYQYCTKNNAYEKVTWEGVGIVATECLHDVVALRCPRCNASIAFDAVYQLRTAVLER